MTATSQRPPRLLSFKFSDALRYAAELHVRQPRKGTTIPYVAHLMAVTALVLEAGGTETEAIAAVLHDGPEDQGGEPVLDEIRARYGNEVAAIVEGCSDTFDTPKPPWRARKEAYIKHLDEAPDSVLIVSLADKLHNSRAILADYRTVGEKVWDRFNADRDDVLWYYRELAKAFLVNAPERLLPLARELDGVVAEVEDLAAAKKT